MRRVLGVAAVIALAAAGVAHAASRGLVAEVRSVQVRVVDLATHAEMLRGQSGQTQQVSLPGDVLFAFDDARLSDAGRRGVAEAARLLHGRRALVVAGFTDARGGAAYNRRLSARRAATVAAVLRAQLPGVEVMTRAHGEAHPIATNRTARGRARNRRVEIRGSR
jgi:outer membrane protein OmpA-like peptidoglycan-associated protein